MNLPVGPTSISAFTPSSFFSAAAARTAWGLYPQELQYLILIMAGTITSNESLRREAHPNPAMISIRKATDRFHTKAGWLDSWHTFSFGDHRDPKYDGFRALRVINDDTVAPGQGFGAHPHRDMEIVSYVLDGALQHRDNLGTGSVIRPGDVQRMSAGTGVVHSEFNGSRSEPAHFLQIWIVPEARGIAPGYEQKRFAMEERRGKLRVLASRDGRDGSVVVHQDAAIYGALLAPGERVEYALAKDRHAWVHLARGAIELNGARLTAGDGAAVSEERALQLTGREGAEVLLFDLA